MKMTHALFVDYHSMSETQWQQILASTKNG